MFRWLWRMLFGSPRPATQGTTIHDATVVEVIDGDTLKVSIQGREESLRLLCADTEESRGGGSKPVTRAGKMASEMAKAWFPRGTRVSLEFESDKPLDWCLKTLRGTYGRLLCHVYKGEEHYNLKLIREGWSPYFDKYGHSEFYHDAFEKAQKEAQDKSLVIWDPETNKGGPSRDYDSLLPWWGKRADALDDFRNNGSRMGALSLLLDYETIASKADTDEEIVLCVDLQQGITYWSESGAVADLRKEKRPFSLWIPGATEDKPGPVVEKIEQRYARRGRGYVYVKGRITSYRERPQLVVRSVAQLTDKVPG